MGVSETPFRICTPMLTAIAVKQAKPGDKPRKLFDSGGLYLLLHPRGGKYWRYKYRHGGKEKVLALGVWPAVSLADARALRDAARSTLNDGADPVESRREEKREALLKAGATFEAVAREWHQKQNGRWIPDHAARVLKSLEEDVFPSLGSRPIGEITPPEVLDVVRAVERRGALDVASRVLQRCASVFRYSIQVGKSTT